MAKAEYSFKKLPIEIHNKLSDYSWMYEHYINKNNSVKELAKALTVSTSVIERRLRSLNIKKPNHLRQKIAKQTNLKKYGYENPIYNSKIKEKIKQTNLKRYGSESPLSNKKIQEKIKQTLVSRYGVDHPMRIDIVKQRAINNSQATSQLKYNGKSSLASNEIKEKIKQTNLKKYGYENPSQNLNIKEKIKTLAFQTGQWNSINGYTTDDLARKLNLSKSYICKLINQFKKQDLSDKEILNFLSVAKARRQNSLEFKISNHFNIDFFNKFPDKNIRYKPDFKLNDRVYLNVDGLYWHSEKIIKDKYHHFNIRKTFEANGLRILQFREDEINYKFPIVCSMINNILGKSKYRIFGRKTEVRRVNQEEAKDFLNENHIMGSIKSVHCGLYYKDELVAIMSYKIFKKDNSLKIDRFCSKINTVVIGGFSKLLLYIKKQTNPDSILYWVDLRYGSGNFLLTQFFSVHHETLGWKWTDLDVTYNRLKCRANMNGKKMSEAFHANKMGLIKIFDAGQLLYKQI